MPWGSLHAAGGDTNTGRHLCRGPLGTVCVAGCIRFLSSSSGVPGTSVAMAHMQPDSARHRERAHSLTWAFPLMS
jgi:hypothetical protein